jgi:serine/threonine-protein kinase
MDEDETRVVREWGEETTHAREITATAGSYSATASPAIPAGTLLINTYRIERLLGSGGMGEVYLARHTGLGTRHAVKVIRPALFENQKILDLFRREASVLRGVRHDAVVSYDGFFLDEHGRDYLVMEFVEGPSLSERLRQRALTLEETLALRDRLANGLAEAHRKGAVHRDISPDNIILANGRLEEAKLIDFGLCKLTDPAQQTIIGSAFAGKYRFASPEQLGLFEGAIDARSDLYSLGLVLAAAITGRPLDMGITFEAVLQARRKVPDLEGVPAALREQLAAMLQPNPADRPQSLGELLERWPSPTVISSSQPGGRRDVPQGTPAAGEKVGHRRHGVWWAFAGTAAVLVLLGSGVYWMLRPLQQPEPPPKPAPQLDELVAMPWGEAAPYFRDWVERGRLDEAFTLLRTLVAQGRPLPEEETYSLARDFLERGRLDNAFALLQVIARDGHAEAALAVGEMYDPLLWKPGSSPFTNPNPRKAEVWYGRAVDRGAAGARNRLEALGRWRSEQGEAGNDDR